MAYFLLGVIIVWFPHSLKRAKALGYDFAIYYQAGLGNFVTEPQYGWLYKDYVAKLFRPISGFGEDVAFTIWYAILSGCYLWLVWHLNPAIQILSLYPMLLALELGQITPMLALLCTDPFGAIGATLIKPYCFIFVLLHAVLRGAGLS